MAIPIEWDLHKAASNLVKHGISLAEGATVLHDPLALYLPDPDHADREVALGATWGAQLLVVVFSEQSQVIRLIRVRRATQHERKKYEESKEGA